MKQSLLVPILAGGLVAGSLDLTAAFVTFGWGAPRAIAAGLLGMQALHGGTGTWMLGVLLHYLIAYLAATVYCVASRRLEFLRPYFLLCGMFYGIAVYLVMNLIVLPSAAFTPLARTSFAGSFRAFWYTCSLSACRSRSAYTSSRCRTRCGMSKQKDDYSLEAFDSYTVN